jgi:leucine dehydrogenase
MKFPPELADVVNEHFSLHFVGGPKGPLGPTGTPTAHGVYMAVKQGARFLWGSESLEGKTIAVQGLGAVGFHLAGLYLQEGARLVVCDRDPAAVGAFLEAHPGAPVQVVDPAEILGVEADIFSPAAAGGILTEENIPSLRFKLIMGGANNVLRASSQAEEIALARLLAKHGILYQVDWWHNVAGVMAGYEEYVNQREASVARLMEKVGKLCTETTWENLNEARREGITPTERAYRVVEREVYGD